MLALPWRIGAPACLFEGNPGVRFLKSKEVGSSRYRLILIDPPPRSWFLVLGKKISNIVLQNLDLGLHNFGVALHFGLVLNDLALGRQRHSLILAFGKQGRGRPSFRFNVGDSLFLQVGELRQWLLAASRTEQKAGA
jgi:hypothetical protein